MILRPEVALIFKLIPLIIVTVIIGLLIKIVYYFIKEKSKKISDGENLNTDLSMFIKILGVQVRKRSINKALLIIGGLPLLLYPMMMIANLMSLAAFSMSENFIDVLPMLIFIIFNSSYLLTYIICCAAYKKRKDKSIITSTIPLIHACAILSIVSLFT